MTDKNPSPARQKPLRRKDRRGTARGIAVFENGRGPDVPVFAVTGAEQRAVDDPAPSARFPLRRWHAADFPPQG